jgi:hypothetical protein
VPWVDGDRRGAPPSSGSPAHTRFVETALRAAGEHACAARRVGGTLRIERPLDADEADGRVVLQLRDRVVLERLAVVLPDDVEARTVVGGDRKVAPTSREPARTGTVTSSVPSVSAVMPTATPTPRYGQTCARSPSMMSASCSPGTKLPMPKFWIENRYSPSAGKSWRATMPPRVPNGIPSSRWFCEASPASGTWPRWVTPVADRHPRDARRGGGVRLEERRRDRERAGDVVEAVRRVVGGSSAVTSTGRSSRSRMALAYSVRFSRRSTTEPGVVRRRGRAIDLRLEPVAQPVVLRQRRPRHPGRRHHACAQLADDLLPDLRIAAAVVQGSPITAERRTVRAATSSRNWLIPLENIGLDVPHRTRRSAALSTPRFARRDSR